MESFLDKYSEVGFAGVIIIAFLWIFIKNANTFIKQNTEILNMFRDEVKTIAECSKETKAIGSDNSYMLKKIADNSEKHFVILKEIGETQKNISQTLNAQSTLGARLEKIEKLLDK